MRKTTEHNQKGFTIIELMISTTVFSVMLVLASAGIIQIGRIYYKGITTNRTQETTRAIVDDVSRNYQITPNTSFRQVNGASGAPSAVCVGLIRYTYQLGAITTESQHGLWTDRIKASGACEPLDLSASIPSDDNTDTTDLGKGTQRELLARNMRVDQFSVSKSSADNTLNVKVRVIYGALDVWDTATQSCKSTLFGGQFCAAASLESFVKARL